jgi:hypothetical protein
VLAEALLVGELGIFFLKMAGIRKHDSGNIHSGRRRQNLTVKAVLDQAGDVTDVVQMRVRQQQPLNSGRWNGQRVLVAQPQLLVALEESAIHHQALTARFHEIF